MSNDRLKDEMEAYQSLNDLLKLADLCKRNFERLGISLPDPLKRIIGIADNGKAAIPGIVVPAPDLRPRPPEADSDWVRVSIKDAMVQSIVLAVLREAKSTISSREVVNQVIALRPDASPGSIANIGTRLNGKLIARSDEGWSLITEVSAPILLNGFLWGPASIFGIHELAAHRREGIIHLLGFFNTGLQNLQIFERLKSCDWIHAPITKDLVKEDMNYMLKEKRARRRGNTKKWEAVAEGTN